MSEKKLYKVEYQGKAHYYADKIAAKIVRRSMQRDPDTWKHGDPVIQYGPDHWRSADE